jgi:hypothetical protein
MTREVQTASLRQPGLAQTFRVVLPVIRAPEMQHLEVTADGEIGRELQVLLGGHFRVLLAAELAISRRQPSVSDVAERRRLPEGGDRSVVAPATYSAIPRFHAYQRGEAGLRRCALPTSPIASCGRPTKVNARARKA